MHTAVGQSSGRRREEGVRTCALAMEEVRGRCEQRAGKRSDGVACTCGRGHPRRRCCPAVLGGSSYDSSSSSKSAASSSASSGSLPLAMAAAARRHNGRGAEVATRSPKGPSAPARGSSSVLSLIFLPRTSPSLGGTHAHLGRERGEGRHGFSQKAFTRVGLWVVYTPPRGSVNPPKQL
jgi:hypothetical protein